MRFLSLTAIIICMQTFSSCAQPHPASPDTIHYLPLGDSYTICEGATTAESWPVLLTQHLNADSIHIELLGNPSRTGFTTQNLIDRELPLLEKNRVDFVTLCIGVNDWVQGVDSSTFHRRLMYILDKVQEKISDKKKIIVLTIPDFGVTPTGAMYSGGRDISAGITAFNNIIRTEATKRGLPIVDLFAPSKKMKTDSSLIAADGLHPSAKEYAIWEGLILPEARRLLKM